MLPRACPDKCTPTVPGTVLALLLLALLVAPLLACCAVSTQ